jgi:hypothetical protein
MSPSMVILSTKEEGGFTDLVTFTLNFMSIMCGEFEN